MVDILIEIGTEEIPASYLKPAINDFSNRLKELLEKNKIQFEKIEQYYTPRRLSLIIKNSEEKSKISKRRIYGPPEKIAIREQKPTKSVEAFATKLNKKVEDIEFVETEKGRYASLLIEEGGISIDSIIKKNIEDIVRAIKFPKTMVWEKNYKFARPVRWLVVMKDNKIIETVVFGIKSNNKTSAHRFSEKRTIEIKTAKDYVKTLKENKIIVSPKERRKEIENKIKQTARAVNGDIVFDEGLLNEVTNIVEYPVTILCHYNEEFLKLPKEILITTLKHHQRAFSIKKDNKIVPYFIVVGNNPELNSDLVKIWYERMVISRLDDAKFFFEEDKKIKLDQLVEREKKVVWIKEIGTLFDKTLRLVSIVEELSKTKEIAVNVDNLKRATYLSKADLLTNIVKEKEYTSLQGIMGSIYAKIQGENEEVVKAIREQYLPSGNEDKLPSTLIGSLLSIIDKIDNIVAAFITGSQPTGSQDPHGIRRQGIGIVEIMVKKKIDIDLTSIIEYTLSLFKKNKKEILNSILQFFKDRVYHYLTGMEYNYDTVRSVCPLYGMNPYDSYLRVNSIQKFREKKEFTDMVIGQKRVVNILKGLNTEGKPEEKLFIQEEERSLFKETKKIELDLQNNIKEKEYEKVMEKLLYLKIFIDKFFDNVLVMTEDKKIKNNRLMLLSYIKKTFFKMADFSHIVLEQK